MPIISVLPFSPRAQVGEQAPFWPEVARARELVAAGAVGRVVSAAAYYYEAMGQTAFGGTEAAGTLDLGWRRSLARAPACFVDCEVPLLATVEWRNDAQKNAEYEHDDSVSSSAMPMGGKRKE